MEITNQKKFGKIETSAFQLRVIAIVSMFLAHFSTLFNNNLNLIFTFLGRLAFPIFAFQIVEGYLYTKDFKKYLKRLFIFAIISEIPFNFLSGYPFINPYSQNVLWTFLIGLVAIRIIDKAKDNTPNKIILYFKILLVCVLGYYIGNVTLVDYYGSGVLIVILFYLTRNCKYKYIFQFIGCLILNLNLGGLNVDILGTTFRVQLFSLLSLIPIWMYKGKQGYTSRAWRNFCYWFYPAHIVILVIFSILMSTLS